MLAHGDTRLAGADDERVDFLNRHRSAPCCPEDRPNAFQSPVY
jgi:hypothetical protein